MSDVRCRLPVTLDGACRVRSATVRAQLQGEGPVRGHGVARGAHSTAAHALACTVTLTRTPYACAQIRTPLNAVGGATALLAGTALDEEQRELVALLEAGTGACSRHVSLQ